MTAKPMISKPMTSTLPGTRPDRQARKDAQRDAVLEAAERILLRDGKAGLSARKLAAQAGFSTKILYSHFDGMNGVVAALYASAFDALAATMRRAGETADGPAGRLGAMARAYRAFLLERPDRAELMYGRTIGTLAPHPEDRAAAKPSIDLYVEGFSALGEADPRAASYAFWAATHGAVVLEMSGWLPDADVFDRLVTEWAGPSE